MKSHLMNFSDASVVLVVLTKLVVFRQLFFIDHEKRHPKVPWHRWCCGSSL
jgi:hypothetical protein